MGLGARIAKSSICFKVTPENTEKKTGAMKNPLLSLSFATLHRN